MNDFRQIRRTGRRARAHWCCSVVLGQSSTTLASRPGTARDAIYQINDDESILLTAPQLDTGSQRGKVLLLRRLHLFCFVFSCTHTESIIAHSFFLWDGGSSLS